MDDLIERYSDTMGLTREGAIRRIHVLIDAARADKSRIAALEASVSHWMGEAKRLLQAGQDGLDRIAALEADKARLMGLVKEAGEALDNFCQAVEYWAGCDEGCTAEAASSEIMSSGGAWPSTAYDKARATLAKIKEAPDANQ